MTVDEAANLLDGLIGPLTVREAIATHDQLDDSLLALLVRWVAGERITVNVTLPTHVERHLAATDEPTDRIDLGDVTLL